MSGSAGKQPEPTPVFQAAEDWWHNAVVGYLRSSWAPYVDGYRTAADRLVEVAAADRTLLDAVIYPIVFLYRQYLELSLKAMIRDLDVLLEHNRRPPTGHRLRPLFDRFRSTFSEFCRNIGESMPDVSRIALLIDEFHVADPTSVVFRYPTDQDGQPSQSYGHINVRVLRDRVAEVAEELDGFLFALSVHQDLRNELLSNWDPY